MLYWANNWANIRLISLIGLILLFITAIGLDSESILYLN